jgi:hypothetical protein
MAFEEYLLEKKINSEAFRQQDSEKWNRLRLLFGQVHPDSFTMQKKFLINDLRRQYRLVN